jgi:hypothetical protein
MYIEWREDAAAVAKVLPAVGRSRRRPKKPFDSRCAPPHSTTRKQEWARAHVPSRSGSSTAGCERRTLVKGTGTV